MSNKFKTLLVLILTCCFSCSYLPEPNLEEPNLILEENSDYILLKSLTTDNNKSGIIFYPGGLVDPHAYISPLKKLVLEDNRTVVIVKVTSNLAIINSQKASDITSKLSATNRWLLGGHSLGGSTACIDLYNNPNDFNGLFLLAAYSVNDLSNVNLPIISITASNDEILDKEKFHENEVNLPKGIIINSPDQLSDESTIGTTIYYDIQGGIHSQFGSYGVQKGDGNATINSDSQQFLVVEMLRKFLINNNL